MARLQILELPEGANDDRAPFVLVVDEYEPCRYVMGLDQSEQPVDEFDGVAEKTGARCVLVFAETIEIPANDIAIPTDEAFKGEVQEWAAGTNRTLAHIIDAVSGKKRRPANDGQRLADERTDIARDMDRLAKRKNELLDALGMDGTRSWDDILISARAFRALHEAEDAAIQRVRDLPVQPEMMNAQQEHPSVWTHGYECGVLAARSALRPRNEPTIKPTDA
jgi:hypothetical protein